MNLYAVILILVEYTESGYAEFHNANSRSCVVMLSVGKLSFDMLSVVMLSILTLSVAFYCYAECC